MADPGADDPRGFLPSVQRDLNLILGDDKASRRRSARRLRDLFVPGGSASGGDVRSNALALVKPMLRALSDETESVREACAEGVLALARHCVDVNADSLAARTSALDPIVPFVVPVLVARLVAVPPRGPAEPTEEIRLKLMNLAIAVTAAYAPEENGGAFVDDGAPPPDLSASSMAETHRRYLTPPASSHRDPAALAPHLAEICSVCQAGMRDPFPDERRAACALASWVASSSRRGFAAFADKVIESVTGASALAMSTEGLGEALAQGGQPTKGAPGPLSHQQYRVRLAACRALSRLVLCGGSGMVERLGPVMSKLALDRNGSVRLAALETAGSWLAGPEREVFDALALPVVLRGISDPADTVRAAGEREMDVLGARVEVDYEAEIQEKLAGLKDSQDDQDYPGRPRIGSRMLVRKRLFRIVPDAVRAANDWGTDTRARAIDLLGQCVHYAESGCVPQLNEIISAIVKANKDADQPVRKSALGVASQLGRRLPVDLVLCMVLPMAGVASPGLIDRVRAQNESGNGGENGGEIVSTEVGPAVAEALSALGTGGTSANQTSAAEIASAVVSGANVGNAAPICETVALSVELMLDPRSPQYPTDARHGAALARLVASVASVAADAGAVTLGIERAVVTVLVTVGPAAEAEASVTAMDTDQSGAESLREVAERIARGQDVAIVNSGGDGGQIGQSSKPNSPSYPGPAGSLVDLVARHTPSILERLLVDVHTWVPGGNSFPVFEALLSLLGPRAASFPLELSPAFRTLVTGEVQNAGGGDTKDSTQNDKTKRKVTPSGKLADRALGLLIPLLPDRGMRRIASEVMRDALIPALVWRAGKEAAGVRERALEGVRGVVEGGGLRDDGCAGDGEEGGWSAITPSLLPVLTSCIDDDCAPVRVAAYRTATSLLLAAPRQFDEERAWKFQNPIFKALDDSSDDARILACDMIASYAPVIPKTYTEGSFERMSTDLALHVDDANPKVRTAVEKAALALGSASAAAAKSVAEKLREAAPRMKNHEGAEVLAARIEGGER